MNANLVVTKITKFVLSAENALRVATNNGSDISELSAYAEGRVKPALEKMQKIAQENTGLYSDDYVFALLYVCRLLMADSPSHPTTPETVKIFRNMLSLPLQVKLTKHEADGKIVLRSTFYKNDTNFIVLHPRPIDIELFYDFTTAQVALLYAYYPKGTVYNMMIECRRVIEVEDRFNSTFGRMSMVNGKKAYHGFIRYGEGNF